MSCFAVVRAILLFPLSLVWGALSQCRRWVYGLGVWPRFRPPLPSVVVGNLSMGGSGKTPFALFIMERLLIQGHTPAYISRGYGRRTRGLMEVRPGGPAAEVGDEALMVKSRLPQVVVVVSEQRKRAVEYILAQHGRVTYLVFDDGYQHLAIEAHKYLLLTPFQKPFYRDWVFPLGSLREFARNAHRAQAIVFTKCPIGKGRGQVESSMPNWLKNKKMLFSQVVYHPAILPLAAGNGLPVSPELEALAFAGTASNQVFFEEVSLRMHLVLAKGYRDHQDYRETDLKEIATDFLEHRAHRPNLIVITTEKDAARLRHHPQYYVLSGIPLYYWPIAAMLGADDCKLLDNILLNP